MSEKNERSLLRLAKLAGIEPAHGWKRRLAAWLDIEPNYLSNWIKRGVPRKALKKIESMGYPREQWLYDEEYRQEEQRMLPAGGRDSDRGSYGVPDLSGFEVRQLIESLTPEELRIVQAFRELDPVSRAGLFAMAILELRKAKEDEAIRRDKRKQEIIDGAIRALGKAISGG